MTRATKLLLLSNGLLLAGMGWLAKRVKLPLFPYSVVQARHPEDLNRGFPPEYDGAHPSDSRSAFEWWYFDAHFSDGHDIVCVMVTPDIFGNHPDQCLVSMHINTPSGEVLDIKRNHPLSAFRASTEGCDVEVAGSTMRGGYPEWRVDVANAEAADSPAAEAHLTFTSHTPGWTRGDGDLVFAGIRRPLKFGWLVAQPRASVQGTISYDGKTFEVEGEGYHDHNWGDFSMPLRMSRWHWGRIITEDLTMVFADVVTNALYGGVRFPTMIIARGDRLALETYEMEWEYSGYALDSTGLQSYARDISFSFAERDVSGRVEFRPKQEMEVTDFFDLTGTPEKLRGPLGKYIAQPCYFRLLCDYAGEIDFGGEKVELGGETIIEYMVFDRRRGVAPKDKPFKHFLHV